MAKKVGNYRARPFRVEDQEELESILFAAGINGLAMGNGQLSTTDLVNTVLTLTASPASKERFARFVTSMWDHPIQAEIDEAEDEENYEKVAELRAKKRSQYCRLSDGGVRNQILGSLVKQQSFKDFLGSFLSLAPEEMATQIRKEVGSVFADMKEQLTKSNGTTESEKEKSGS